MFSRRGCKADPEPHLPSIPTDSTPNAQDHNHSRFLLRLTNSSPVKHFLGRTVGIVIFLRPVQLSRSLGYPRKQLGLGLFPLIALSRRLAIQVAEFGLQLSVRCQGNLYDDQQYQTRAAGRGSVPTSPKGDQLTLIKSVQSRNVMAQAVRTSTLSPVARCNWGL